MFNGYAEGSEEGIDVSSGVGNFVEVWDMVRSLARAQ